MVFEWGMDYTGMSSRQNYVGSVNGQELTYEQFTDLYQQLYQNQRQRQEENLNETQLENLRGQVWDQFVQRVIFQEEIDKLGIKATDEEIRYQIKNYPLDEFKQNPNFQTNGQFDWDKYYASFGNPDIPWIQIEEFYRQQLPFQKLQNVITSTVRVGDSEVEQEFLKTNLKAKVAYLEIPFNSYRDKITDISDEEAREYYDNNQSEFEREETRDLAYVSFPLVPTATDSARIMDEFAEIRRRIDAGEDFNELAMEYSEDPAKSSNQGRYDFFERGAMVKPFEEAAFNGKPGAIVGPVETQFGLHLIKIEDKRIQDGKEQVKVSHILLKIVAGPSTREKVENTAAFFAEDARTEGFERMAEEQNREIKKTGLISEKMNFIPGFGRNYSISNFAFKGAVNDVSDLIYTEDGFAVFKISEIKPAGVRPFEEVITACRTKVKQEKEKQLARDYAGVVEDWLSGIQDFNSILARDTAGVIKYDTTAEFSLGGSIPGIGFDHKFNATAFSLDPQEISNRIETNRGVYWQKSLSKTQFDSTLYAAQRESIRQRLLAQKKNQVFNEWYEYLKENSEIVDNRKMFNL
jgi:parvulin-like peptidyl-prolyl isomerase